MKPKYFLDRHSHKNIYDLWQAQKNYNFEIQTLDGTATPEYWTQIYLLGLISEVDEVLDMINWKRNRRQNKVMDRNNLAFELADLTKFVLSLWQAWDFTVEEFIAYTATKSELLTAMLKNETEQLPTDRKVIVSDLDGTIANWRATFLEWISMNYTKTILQDALESLQMDSDLSMKYSDYYYLKEQFEQEGGYRWIEPYDDAVETILELQREYDAYLIFVTSRPANKYKRIWMDTWLWLEEQKLFCDKLSMTDSGRILLANKLVTENNCEVIILEDNPLLAKRAAENGQQVICRAQPYNIGAKNGNIRRVAKFSQIPLAEYFG